MRGLALFLTAGFIFYLLRCDSKQSRGLSRALWLPTLWMIYEAGRPLAAWMLVSEDEASSPVDQGFLAALLVLVLIVLVRRRLNISAVWRANPWMALLLTFMLASVVWSDIPFVSFKRWIREFEAVAMACVVLTESNPAQALEAVLRRVIYFNIPLSIALVKYLPEYGVQFNRWTGDIMWVGVSTQKNGLGILCLISTYFIIWTLWRRRQGRNVPASKYQSYADYFVLLLTLLLLKGPPGKYSSSSGYSSTSIAALGIGLIIFFGLSWLRKRGKTMSPITATGMVLAFITYGTALPLAGGLLGGITAAFGRDSTFTGRTEIWSQLVPVMQASPILGCGFGGFWTPEKRAIYIIGQAHNGYLEVLMEMGWVGLGLVAMFFIGCARKALRALPHDFDLASIALGMVLIATLHNATEATMNSFTNFLTAVVLFFSACIGASPIEPASQPQQDPGAVAEEPAVCAPMPTS